MNWSLGIQDRSKWTYVVSDVLVSCPNQNMRAVHRAKTAPRIISDRGFAYFRVRIIDASSRVITTHLSGRLERQTWSTLTSAAGGLKSIMKKSRDPGHEGATTSPACASPQKAGRGGALSDGWATRRPELITLQSSLRQIASCLPLLAVSPSSPTQALPCSSFLTPLFPPWHISLGLGSH